MGIIMLLLNEVGICITSRTEVLCVLEFCLQQTICFDVFSVKKRDSSLPFVRHFVLGRPTVVAAVIGSNRTVNGAHMLRMLNIRC